MLQLGENFGNAFSSKMCKRWLEKIETSNFNFNDKPGSEPFNDNGI